MRIEKLIVTVKFECFSCSQFNTTLNQTLEDEAHTKCPHNVEMFSQYPPDPFSVVLEEVLTAQKDRDQALMSRLLLANEERDEALLRARRLQQAAEYV